MKPKWKVGDMIEKFIKITLEASTGEKREWEFDPEIMAKIIPRDDFIRKLDKMISEVLRKPCPTCGHVKLSPEVP